MWREKVNGTKIEYEPESKKENERNELEPKDYKVV
jgi:hypothetical protein